MQTPLIASANTAGALLSNYMFEVPEFQREYSWQEDEVADFWNDLSSNIDSEEYFLGLVILTDEGSRKQVVDGQQRLLTVTLLATALYYEALKRGRKALADRIQADFLRSIDYDSDDTDPRIVLSNDVDNSTFQYILAHGRPPSLAEKDDDDEDTFGESSVSDRLIDSYNYLSGHLRDDLKADPFKRLGKWTEFLTRRVYFAVFVHPDSSSAYRVFEVINTRGKDLTTADLLKNYVLSQTKPMRRKSRYKQWLSISRQFYPDGGTFVQYIRHAVTVQSGHILPKDLFDYLAQRSKHLNNDAPNPDELMSLLEEHLPLYLQMIDPTSAGPAEPEALKIFSALNSLGVIAVRPILLAAANVPNSLQGMRYVLRLVVRRIVVGNLGTGNVERKFGEAAKRVREKKNWRVLIEDLDDLNPDSDTFVEQLQKRSFNKGVLNFLRRSILGRNITPKVDGTLHFIWTKQASNWDVMSEEDSNYWSSTIGNTFLSTLERRPKNALDWPGFKENMLPYAVKEEWKPRFERVREWNANTVERLGRELAEVGGEVWYG